jgi:hypothetical protein
LKPHDFELPKGYSLWAPKGYFIWLPKWCSLWPPKGYSFWGTFFRSPGKAILLHFPFRRRPGRTILLSFPSRTLQAAVLRRGALQMGLPLARPEIGQKNYFLYKEFTNSGWSLRLAILLHFLFRRRLGRANLLSFPARAVQAAILRRGALQMGLPLARPEIGQKNYFLYKEFANFGWSLQLAILFPFLAFRKPSEASQKALPLASQRVLPLAFSIRISYFPRKTKETI